MTESWSISPTAIDKSGSMNVPISFFPCFADSKQYILILMHAGGKDYSHSNQSTPISIQMKWKNQLPNPNYG